ncbi:hypothetical protein HHI36_019300 [Cryptolaemus montrouzieri]|uniref:Uncharacterized protein n=1 Tax=Cryptolaemus montrouzieri TaxID=559131 RepID=A0ABD2P2G4_9CUCU
MSEWELHDKQQMKEDIVQFDRMELELNEQNTKITELLHKKSRSTSACKKNDRSPGPGQVKAELLKSGPDILFEWLTHLFNRCLSGKQLPEDFRKGYITNIYREFRGSSEQVDPALTTYSV